MCVCVCVSQIASAILLTAQLFIYKKQNKISCNACWSTLVQWNATKIYFKKKTRQWPWNLQHLATPTICVTKQPKLLQHKDKLHQQQHFAWWAQIQSEGLCWSSDLKIHPWVKDTVMIMMIIMIHIVFQSALIYLFFVCMMYIDSIDFWGLWCFTIHYNPISFDMEFACVVVFEPFFVK